MSPTRTALYFGIVVAIGLGVILTAVLVPQVGVSVPIIAVGLALALQKYTASVVASFVITFSNIYALGDRIRIGNIKGDVRKVSLLHTTLEEVGEDEKMGGELTGRLLHVPNLLVLDQPVLNYSKDYSVYNKTIASDYVFDEVRIPISSNSDPEKAAEMLERILKSEDELYLREARQVFQDSYPRFFKEALNDPRVLVHIEPSLIWLKGKFVTSVRNRNELRSKIQLRFVKETKGRADIKLA